MKRSAKRFHLLKFTPKPRKPWEVPQMLQEVYDDMRIVYETLTDEHFARVARGWAAAARNSQRIQERRQS